MAVHLIPFGFTSVSRIIYPLVTVFITYSDVHQEIGCWVIFRINKSGINGVSGIILVFRLLVTNYSNVSIGNIIISHKAGSPVNILYFRIETAYIIVETGRTARTALVFVSSSHAYQVIVTIAIRASQIAHPFFFIQRAEITHILLLVQVEQFQRTSCLFKHHLSAVRLFAGSLAIRTAPVQIPLFSKLMVSVQLMILKGINVGYRVITDQFIVFIIFSLSQHIGILRITCIEEGVPNTVGLSKCISQVTKSCQFQFLTVTVVVKPVEGSTSGLKCTIKSIFCGFIGIACTQRGQQTQILSIYIPVLSTSYITAKFRKTCTLIHIEGCMKRIFLRNGS